MSHSPHEILARLEQLKQWQEEQQRVLLQKQIVQRELLTKEQQQMYELLGLAQAECSVAELDVAPTDVIGTPDDTETEDEQINVEIQKESSSVPKRPFLKRGEGLKARFKVDPNCFKLDNLPKYKYARKNPTRTVQNREKCKTVAQKPSVEKMERKRSTVPPTSGNSLTLNINKVQRKKLVVEKADLTPESTEFDDELHAKLEQLKKLNEQGESATVDMDDEAAVCVDVPWKMRLGQPNASTKELRALNFFEQLEQKVSSKSFSSNSSSILRFIAANESSVVEDPDAANETDGTEPLVRQEELPNREINPPPPVATAAFDSTEESFDSSDEEDDDNTGRETNDLHVRFVDHTAVEEDDTVLESRLEAIALSKMSTPNDKFIRRSSPGNQDEDETSQDEETVTENEQDTEQESMEQRQQEQQKIRNDILAKSEVLKQRLIELEQEIENFRRENAALIQQKQEHELEKIKLQQDREEMEAKMNDERIKMEVYFHDERMKIEDERKKALKEALRPTKKEKEEILRLTEEIAELRKQQKEKDSKHAASLSRFRSQSKALEKELYEAKLQLDVAKKDNRKLETENSRLKRQNNSRMLLEINKNIAKLAAPVAVTEKKTNNERQSSSPEKPRNTQPRKMVPFRASERKVPADGKVIKAKVVSHQAVKSTRESQHLGADSSEDEMENGEQSSASDPSVEEDEVLGEDSSSGPEEIERKSSYFTGRAKHVAEETQQPKRQSIAVNTDRSAETAELIKNLKREIVNNDGSRDIWYPNGNLKKVSPDGLNIRMLYFNKDIKETNVHEGTTRYYYYETNTWHTTYLDGLEILEFPDGQTEHRFKDGSTEVHFPNGSIRTTNPNSTDIAEEWKYPDGSTVIIKKNDDKIIKLPNGQVEIHTQAHKRRIYPDGTVKFVYPDGSQESRYSNGRIRLKDKDGRLISDTGGSGGTPSAT